MTSADEILTLNIKTQSDLDRFHKAWLLPFLENAQPNEHMLAEDLLAKGHITQHTYDILTGSKCSRRDLARKYWMHLTKVKIDDFLRDLAPRLCEHYHHLIPAEYRNGDGPVFSEREALPPKDVTGGSGIADPHQLCQDSKIAECFHHRLKHPDLLRPMADVLYSCNCISRAKYEEYTGDKDLPETIWPCLFEACKAVEPDRATQLDAHLCQLLPKSLHSDFTASVRELVQSGIPCTCSDISLNQEMDKCESPKERDCSENLFEDNTLLTWARNNELTQNLLQALHENDFKTFDDIQLLKATKIEDYFKKESKISSKDYAILLRALKNLPVKPTNSLLQFLQTGESVRILILGKTGSGKSSTGNRILGAEVFSTSPGFKSESETCVLQQREDDNKIVEVMDCPGVFDTREQHEQISETIVQAVAGLHPGPDVVLFLIKVGRYTEEELQAFQRLKAMFDDSITRHMVVVFTHVDHIRGKCASPEVFVETESTPALKQVLEECGNRFVCLDNSKDAPETVAEKQLKSLAEKIREVRDINAGKWYVCERYEAVYFEVEKEVRKRIRRSQSASTYDSGYGGPFLDQGDGELSAEEASKCDLQDQSDLIYFPAETLTDKSEENENKSTKKVIHVNNEALKSCCSSDEESKPVSEPSSPQLDTTTTNQTEREEIVSDDLKTVTKQPGFNQNQNANEEWEASYKTRFAQLEESPTIRNCQDISQWDVPFQRAVDAGQETTSRQEKKLLKVDKTLIVTSSSDEEKNNRKNTASEHDYSLRAFPIIGMNRSEHQNTYYYSAESTPDHEQSSASAEEVKLAEACLCNHDEIQCVETKDVQTTPALKKVVPVNYSLLNSDSSSEDDHNKQRKGRRSLSAKVKKKHKKVGTKIANENSEGVADSGKTRAHKSCRRAKRSHTDKDLKQQVLQDLRRDVTKNKSSSFFARLLRLVRAKLSKIKH